MMNSGVFAEFFENFRHNLFKPLLLFFYMGFLVPILGVEFEFPHVMYQALTIYLLVSIGWNGGEELAELNAGELTQALELMGVGFVTNFVIGIVAYILLRSLTGLRKVDAATVAGYYGSDSAGTFATAKGVLNSLAATGAVGAAAYEFKAYMPVMLAVMEVPGCLVALFLVARLRAEGMDARGFLPNEDGYDPDALPPSATDSGETIQHPPTSHGTQVGELGHQPIGRRPTGSIINLKLLHEVFLNPGLYLLFGGIVIGFLSGLQNKSIREKTITGDDDRLFLGLFQGVLCLFLLEMGMTASRKLKDLRQAGLPFVALGLIMPPIFATFGIVVAHLFNLATHADLTLGTYVMFSILCGAASYIAVPAVQRLAIPEASPTLPLAASLGLTFSFNVTVGIPLYIQIAKAIQAAFPAG